MIELAENLIQLAVLILCFGASCYQYSKRSSRTWLFLSLYYVAMLLGELYWVLMLVLLHSTSIFDYVSESTWFSAYLFLYLMTKQLLPEGERTSRSFLIWVGPVFTACMAVFYMQWGRVLSNIFTAVAMGLIFMNATQGLLMMRGKSAGKYPLKRCFQMILAFCLVEYALWPASCFWSGETLENPCYWLDILLSFSLLLLFVSVKEADDR